MFALTSFNMHWSICKKSLAFTKCYTSPNSFLKAKDSSPPSVLAFCERHRSHAWWLLLVTLSWPSICCVLSWHPRDICHDWPLRVTLTTALTMVCRNTSVRPVASGGAGPAPEPLADPDRHNMSASKHSGQIIQKICRGSFKVLFWKRVRLLLLCTGQGRIRLVDSTSKRVGLRVTNPWARRKVRTQQHKLMPAKTDNWFKGSN